MGGCFADNRREGYFLGDSFLFSRYNSIMPEGSSQEKTENATPRRLREARKKGQVPKSKDVETVFVLIALFMTMAATMGMMGGEFKHYFQLCFSAIAVPQAIDGGVIWGLGKAGLLAMAKALAPIFLAGMVMAVFIGMIQVGTIFSGETLKPKLEKLNPIEGLKNMFQVVALIELAKNIAKMAVVFYIAYSTLKKAINDVLLTSTISMLDSAKLGGHIIMSFFIKVCVCFIVIAIIDFVIQRWNFMKNMRMTKEEVKREYKQDEGDPAVKGERRRLHREMAFGDVKRAVKKADVVVTNPVHVACVLEYNKTEMGAPTLTAKGQRQFAQMIIDLAKEEGIPIVRNIPLAWSLLHLEVDDEVPEDLYEAVAEVLTIVYEMKQEKEKSPENPPSVYA